jgi:hypothetical protein
MTPIENSIAVNNNNNNNNNNYYESHKRSTEIEQKACPNMPLGLATGTDVIYKTFLFSSRLTERWTMGTIQKLSKQF